MGTSSSKSSLRIIAVKPHETCLKRYSKILKDNFYIFYDDYEEKNGKLVKKKKEALEKATVPPNFYPTENGVSVSISAIIGKNGDGKSTIVELIMRILNNFAYAAGFTENQDSLKKINGLEAELYYELNDSLYSIISKGDDIIWERYGEKPVTLGTSPDKLGENKKKIDEIDLGEDFFYTQVSNYSLYAYNSRELEGESDEGPWIDGIFHKNDGYQTPIVLNPKRTEGDIDVNTENDLTKQRLISLLITDTLEDSFRWINDKQLAQAFQISLFEKTKLELTTFLDFFKNYWRKDRKDYFSPKDVIATDLQVYINDIERLGKMASQHYDNKDDMTSEIKKSASLLDTLYEITCLVDNAIFQKYLIQSKKIYDEVKKIHNTIPDYLRSLRQLIKNGNIDSTQNEELANKTNKVQDYFRSDINHLNQLDPEEEALTGHANFAYLQRIVTVAMCEEIWKEKIKDKKRTTEENVSSKIMDYLIYKTISIISKYPNYKELSKSIFTAIDFTTDSEKIQSLKDNLKTAINKIWDDIHKTKSHITLKMRQCINFLEDHPYGNQAYVDNEVKYVNISKFYYEIKKWKDESKENLYDYFFPPIFDSNILLKQIKRDEVKEFPAEENLFADYDLENDKVITLFSQLSSGERQQINVVSAVIYHLRNIDSVSDKSLVKYRHVNLIFEEIELYFHPEYQRIFLNFLLKHISKAKLKLKSINLCFVTHSPFILSDIPQQNILVLEKGKSLPDKPFNLGANIHEMLGHNFMLNYTTGEIVRLKIDKFLEQYLAFKELPNKEDYKFPKGYNWGFLIGNMGEGYLKNLLNGYYEEMMQSSVATYNKLIKQKQDELKELKVKRDEKIKKERENR